MPLYEYRCQNCGEKTSVLTRAVKEPNEPLCPRCGASMVRCLSAFAYHRSEATRLENTGDPDRPGPDYYRDPRNIGRWAEKRFEEMGVEMPGEIQDKIAAARDGVLPESLKDL